MLKITKISKIIKTTAFLNFSKLVKDSQNSFRPNASVVILQVAKSENGLY